MRAEPLSRRYSHRRPPRRPGASARASPSPGAAGRAGGRRRQEPWCRGAVSRGGREGFAAGRGPAARQRRGGAGPGRACAPAAPLRAGPGRALGSPSSEQRQSAASGRQVNTPFGRCGGCEGPSGGAGFPQPRPCRPPRGRVPGLCARGRARLCVLYSADTSGVMCPSGKARSRVPGKALSFRFSPPIAAHGLSRNSGCSPWVG